MMRRAPSRTQSAARPAAVAALVVLLLPCAAHAQATPAATDPVAPLAWMAGCWALRTPTRVTEEQWMRPAGGAMVGMSRTVAGGAMREWEALRLTVTDGRVSYIALPSGQRETVFPAVHVSDTLAAFENRQHDFPQRIEYRRVGTDSLVARISGPQGGRERAIRFAYARATCG